MIDYKFNGTTPSSAMTRQKLIGGTFIVRMMMVIIQKLTKSESKA